jgi:hypothetical protein
VTITLGQRNRPVSLNAISQHVGGAAHASASAIEHMRVDHRVWLHPQVKLVALSLVASDEARVHGVRSVRARRFLPYPWSGDSVSALTASVLLVVEASGGISVHAPVRVHRIPPACPFAPWRALKGDRLAAAAPSFPPTVRGSVGAYATLFRFAV